jgi:hypothetical protein
LAWSLKVCPGEVSEGAGFAPAPCFSSQLNDASAAYSVLFSSQRRRYDLITLVFRVVVGTFGTFTHLVTQRCASDASYNGTHRPQKGTRGRARNTTAYGSYSFTSVNIIRVGLIPIAFVAFSHPSHSFDL